MWWKRVVSSGCVHDARILRHVRDGAVHFAFVSRHLTNNEAWSDGVDTVVFGVLVALLLQWDCTDE